MKRCKLLLCGVLILLLTGCFNKDDFSERHTYTTIYPIEYVTNYLYSNYSNVSSIYPNGSDVETYELTEKQVKKYSSGDKFIYGSSSEAHTAVDFLNQNKDIQIVDAMKGMNYTYEPYELWLDPSNYLMMALNIKNGLLEYETNVYKKEEISNLYNELKVKISEIDVENTLMGKNAKSTYLLVYNDSFKYLEKYGINVLSLSDSNTNIEKTYVEANNLISEGKIKYFYVLKGTIPNEKVSNYIKDKKLETIEIHSLINLTDDERKQNNDYISIMTSNIELFKKELFK